MPEEMLVSFLRRRLGSVLYLLHRVCAVFCATEAVALTVMLLSLPLRCQQNCVGFGVPTMIFIIIVIIIIVSLSQPATIAYSRLVASCHDSTFRCCKVQML